MYDLLLAHKPLLKGDKQALKKHYNLPEDCFLERKKQICCPDRQSTDPSNKAGPPTALSDSYWVIYEDT